MLLLFCYPGSSPALDTLDDVLAVHASASKYCMEAVETCILTTLLSSPLMEQEPLRIFAIAMANRWEEVARAGARNTLTFPVYGRPRVEELQFISALEYHQLLDYHWKCGNAATKLADVHDHNFRHGWIARKDFVWFGPHGKSTSECSAGASVWWDVRYTTRQWWLDYMSEVADSLTLQPRGITVMEPAIVNKAVQRAIGCITCRQKVIPQMKEFVAMFAAEVERVISEVNCP